MAGRSPGGRSNRKPTSGGRAKGASAGRSKTSRAKTSRSSAGRSKTSRAKTSRSSAGRSLRRGREPFFSDRFRELAPIVAVAGLVIVVLAGLAVLPARTWLTQRQNLRDATAELEQVEAEVAVLEAELELLQTDAEIERQARANFDLVYPGEESYRILPPDAD